MSILEEKQRVIAIAERILNSRNKGNEVDLEVKDYKLMIDSYVEFKSITEEKGKKLIEMIECDYENLQNKYNELISMI